VQKQNVDKLFSSEPNGKQQPIDLLDRHGTKWIDFKF